MTTQHERDNRIAAWLDREAPAHIDDAVLHHILERTQATAQRADHPWMRRMAVPTLSATAVMAAVAVLVLVVAPRSGEVAPSGSTAPGTSGTPRASTEPSTPPTATQPSVAPPSMPVPLAGWSAFALPDPRPEEVQGEVVNDVVAGGPGFVAVGRSYPAAATAQDPYDVTQWAPAIWTSIDGVTWELAANVESIGPADLRAVATGPDGVLLTVGYPNEALGPDDEATTGVGMWKSTDGINWEAVRLDSDVYGFADVVGTDDGWFVVGHPNGVGPTIFASTDLATWTEEPVASEEDEIDGVIGNASGRVLAYGCDHPPDDGFTDDFGCAEPMGWLRADAGWDAIALPVLPTAGAMIDDRYAIVGQTSEGSGAFISVDGRTWEAGDVIATGYVYSMTVTSDGLAVGGTLQTGGTIPSGDDEFLPAVWHSTDGLRWSAADVLPVEGTPNEPTVMAIIETPSGLVGLGYAYYDKPVAQGWVRLPR
jgi:hypothetical protein